MSLTRTPPAHRHKGPTMTVTLEKPTIEQTAFGPLESAKRLQNPVHKAPTHQPGRFGFRGELALRFSEQLADEARPPELTCDQVMAVAQAGEPTIPFFLGLIGRAHVLTPVT